jgi:alpha-galactosidase
VNIDDAYYESPDTVVDAYGRWVVDATKFPSGMAAMGAFVHNLGLKFGMYMTPGIPSAAVAENTPIEGTAYHASDIVLTGADAGAHEEGPNVMLYIDYSKPGAQEFVNSWANLLVSYGVDFLKLDGVGPDDLLDVQAWSSALRQSGRTIHLELSNSLAKVDANTWSTLANGWRIDNDIECYCTQGSSYPLTDWGNVQWRLADAIGWQQFSHPYARNDFDSLELGNGDDDGLTPDERRLQMSFWALSAVPLILGSDLTDRDRELEQPGADGSGQGAGPVGFSGPRFVQRLLPDVGELPRRSAPPDY